MRLFWGGEDGDEVIGGGFAGIALCAWVEEFAGDAVGFAVFHEFDAEVSGVGGVFLGLAEGGGLGVLEVDGRVVAGDEGVGGVFCDPWEDGVAAGEEFLEL